MNYKKLAPCLLLLAVFYTLSLVPCPLSHIRGVYAQVESGTTAIPPKVELVADPGETIKTTLKVRNESDVTLYYGVVIDDIIVSDTEGTPLPVTESVNSKWSMKSWIKSPSLLPVDRKDTAIVNLTINVPANALPGGHFAMVTYEANPDANPGTRDGKGSLIGQRTGTIIYLTVNGPITQNASVRQFSTSKFHEFGPVEFTGLIENLSDVHINAKGKIVITDLIGREVASLPVETGNIFPEASRFINSKWDQKWGYGRYQAALELSYGSAGGLLVSTINFWLFPIRIVIYSLIVVISILLLVVILNKKNKKHQEQLEAEVAHLKEELEHKDQG